GRVPPKTALCPSLRMLTAALVSLSSSVPQLQLCHRSDRSFFTSAPHPEQICDVLNGFTKMTVRPAHAALTLTISVNVLHPASRIDLFNPAFALAPLGKYCPFSSCFGAGALVRFFTCKSSKAMT